MANTAYKMKTARICSTEFWFTDKKETLEALRNLYLLHRNGDKKRILVCINLLRIENCGLIKLITVAFYEYYHPL